MNLWHGYRTLSNARVEVLPAPVVHGEIAAATASTSSNFPVPTLRRSSCDDLPVISSCTPVPTTNQSSSAENAPQYKLDRSVKTVMELWNEWHYGRGGQPLIAELNDRFGAQ